MRHPTSTGAEVIVKGALMNTVTIVDTVIEAGIIREENTHIPIPAPVALIGADMMIRGLRADAVKLPNNFFCLVSSKPNRAY